MQPLGGSRNKGTAEQGRRRGGASKRSGGGRGSDSPSGILLRTQATWRGRSQRFGARRTRGPAAGLRLPVSWRAAACLFLAASTLYGLVIGGYPERLADYLTRTARSVVVDAGFAIRKLTIEGQARTSDKEIIRALGLSAHQSMLAFDSGAAQDRLEKLPWVRHAQVMRLLPSRLHIVIEERTPFAIWQRRGKTHLIDREGVVITAAKLSDHPGLPLVVGAGAAKHAAALYALLDDRPQLRARVRAAVRVAERRWNLMLDNGVEIKLPEDGVGFAMGKLEDLEREHGILSSRVAAVDLRLPDRITVRLTKEAAGRLGAAFTTVPGRMRGAGRDT